MVTLDLETLNLNRLFHSVFNFALVHQLLIFSINVYLCKHRFPRGNGVNMKRKYMEHDQLSTGRCCNHIIMPNCEGLVHSHEGSLGNINSFPKGNA